jgi:hypothetical protein
MLTGYIYLLYNDINNEYYVGLTTRTVQERFEEHKQSARNDMPNALYTNMRNVGISNCHITCLETYVFDGNSKEYFTRELKKLEDGWIVRLKPSLNTIFPKGCINEKQIQELNKIINNATDNISSFDEVSSDDSNSGNESNGMSNEKDMRNFNCLNDDYDMYFSYEYISYRNKQTNA